MHPYAAWQDFGATAADYAPDSMSHDVPRVLTQALHLCEEAINRLAPFVPPDLADQVLVSAAKCPMLPQRCKCVCAATVFVTKLLSVLFTTGSWPIPEAPYHPQLQKNVIQHLEKQQLHFLALLTGQTLHGSSSPCAMACSKNNLFICVHCYWKMSATSEGVFVFV